MPQPFVQPGKVVCTRSSGEARLCLKSFYKKIELPPGTYRIEEVRRKEEYWHIPEASDGYTYRLVIAG